MIIENQNSVRLCRQGSCCPNIKKFEDRYEITDDYNGKVILTPEEFDMLSEVVNHFRPQE